jgi:tetratricopeptide (TPR) repeat protein
VQLARAEYKLAHQGELRYEPISLKRAHALLAVALALDPTLFEAYVARAYVRAFQNDAEGVSRDLDHVQRLRPGAPQIDLVHAVQARAERSWAKAADRYRSALAKTREARLLVEAYAGLATTLQSAGDAAGADKAFRGLLLVDPTSRWGLINYVHFLGSQNRHDEAITVASGVPESVDFNRDLLLADAHVAKGIRLIQVHSRLHEGAVQLKLALQAHPSHGAALHGLGICAYRAALQAGTAEATRAMLSEAERYFGAAREAWPEVAFGRPNMKDVLEARKRLKAQGR